MQRALLLAIILISGAVAPAAADWSMFQGDKLNTGDGEEIVRDDQLWWTWSAAPGSHVDASPVVGEGVVVIADSKGRVTALDAESGRPLWNYKMGDPVASTPAIAFGWVYVADIKGDLVALDLRDGAKVAEAKVGATRAPITIAEGKLFIGNEAGAMKAYTATTLDLLWTFTVSKAREGPVYNNVTDSYTCSGGAHPARPIRTAPTVHMGMVIFGSMNHYLYAVDEQGEPDQTTTLQWRHRTNDIVLASPVVDTSTLHVFFASYDETVRSLPLLPSDAGTIGCIGADPAALWVYDVPGPIDASKVHSTPAFDGQTLYFGANNGNVYAIDKTTGAEKWRISTDGPVLASPVVGNGTVVVGSDDGVIRWLDASNGTEVQRFRADSPIKTGAAVHGGTVIVVTEDGTVYRMGGTPPARPDLAVTNIERSGNGIAVAVTNVGARPSVATILQIWDNGTMVQEHPIPILEPNETLEWLYLTIGHIGPLTIDVVIDPEQEGFEAGRENNQATQVIVFAPPIEEGNLTLEPEATGPARFLGMPWWTWIIIGGVLLAGAGVGGWIIWRRRATEFETSEEWYDDEYEDYDDYEDA